MEHHLAIVDNIRSHASKWFGKVGGEVQRVGKPEAQLLEKFGQVLTLDDTSCIHVALTDGQARREEIGVLFLAVDKTLTTHIFLVGNDITPVLHPYHRVERVGVVADGIESANDATHRRSCNDVYGDSCLLKHFQRSDMRHTLCAATAKNDGHLFPWRFLAVVLCHHRTAYQYGSNE